MDSDFGIKFERLSLILCHVLLGLQHLEYIANNDALIQIANANAAGGNEYADTPQTIQSVYNQISQFF